MSNSESTPSPDTKEGTNKRMLPTQGAPENPLPNQHPRLRWKSLYKLLMGQMVQSRNFTELTSNTFYYVTMQAISMDGREDAVTQCVNACTLWMPLQHY